MLKIQWYSFNNIKSEYLVNIQKFIV